MYLLINWEKKNNLYTRIYIYIKFLKIKKPYLQNEKKRKKNVNYKE
jgi:hypothetical protein